MFPRKDKAIDLRAPAATGRASEPAGPRVKQARAARCRLTWKIRDFIARALRHQRHQALLFLGDLLGSVALALILFLTLLYFGG